MFQTDSHLKLQKKLLKIAFHIVKNLNYNNNNNTNNIQNGYAREDICIEDYDDTATTNKILFFQKVLRNLFTLQRHFDLNVTNNVEILTTTSASDILKMEEKMVTIVFWDIKGFSALCTSLEVNPILLTEFLREFFEIATQVIFEYGGVLDKFIGDGIMAIFGPQTNDQDGTHSAICAVAAAVDLREKFNALQLKWIGTWEKYIPIKITIGLKCGINTGYATVGNIGTKKREHFTAIGINVNIANRLANMSSSNQIIVTVTTKSKVKNRFEIERLGTIDDLKNIPGRFEIFFVIKKKHSCTKTPTK